MRRRRAFASFLGRYSGIDTTLLRHLLTCRRCAIWALAAIERAEPVEIPTTAYDAMWERLTASIERASRLVDREREDAESLLTELLALAEELRPKRITEPRFASRALGIRLIQESESSVLEDPVGAERLALLAVTLVERHGVTGSYVDLEGIAVGAWCAVAEGRRARADLAGAEAAFQRASRWLEGAIDPVDSAGYCLGLGRLRREERRFAEALTLLGRASSLFGELGQTRDQATAQREIGLIGSAGRDAEQGMAATGVISLAPSVGEARSSRDARTGRRGNLAPFADPGLARRLAVLLRRRLRSSVARAEVSRLQLDEPSH